MIKRIVRPLLSLVLFAGVTAHAVELTEEQRAAIAERISPVGDVCLQGESCGGLPDPETSAKSASMVASAGSGSGSGSGSSTSGSSQGSGSASTASASSGSSGASSSSSDDEADSSDGSVGPGEGASNVAVAVADGESIDGESIYNQACMACHASGAGGAPKVGDVDAWTARIAKGRDALHQSGIKGVAGTAMMAKGGRMDLSDQEVMAAVDYMIETSQ